MTPNQTKHLKKLTVTITSFLPCVTLSCLAYCITPLYSVVCADIDCGIRIPLASPHGRDSVFETADKVRHLKYCSPARDGKFLEPTAALHVNQQHGKPGSRAQVDYGQGRRPCLSRSKYTAVGAVAQGTTRARHGCGQSRSGKRPTSSWSRRGSWLEGLRQQKPSLRGGHEW